MYLINVLENQTNQAYKKHQGGTSFKEVITYSKTLVPRGKAFRKMWRLSYGY